jgi:nitrilase
MPARIAVIQKPPVRLDRDGTIAKAIKAIDEAGASLLVFPEAWIPGYPTWVWRLKPGMAPSDELHGRLRQNAVVSSVEEVITICCSA